jgi:hypothetical protein
MRYTGHKLNFMQQKRSKLKGNAFKPVVINCFQFSELEQT